MFFSTYSGIVSFTDQKDFDDHWEDYEKSSIPSSKITKAKQFLTPLIKSELEDFVVLDVGCGNGVHAVVLQDDFSKQKVINYIGLDISLSGLMAASHAVEDIDLLHGDALNLPIQTDTIDAAFSYGVLGYTESPEKGIHEMARVVRPGGYVGIWLCPKMVGISGFVLSSIRNLCGIAPRWVVKRIADFIVPFMPILPVNSRVNLKNATWFQCREVVLVNIAPTHLIYPDIKEVRRWIENAGLSIVFEDTQNPITIWAQLRV